MNDVELQLRSAVNAGSSQYFLTTFQSNYVAAGVIVICALGVLWLSYEILCDLIEYVGKKIEDKRTKRRYEEWQKRIH